MEQYDAQGFYKKNEAELDYVSKPFLEKKKVNSVRFYPKNVVKVKLST